MGERRGVLRWVAIIVAYVLVAAAVVGANPFRGETVGPFDLLMAQPGWAAGTAGPHPVRNAERTDVIDAMLPRWMFARQTLRDGHLPLWNPLPGGGEADLQNLASSQLTPAFALFASAPTPAWGIYLATLFNLTLAGLGAHAWLSRRLRPVAAAFGGITFMLCGFHAAWLYWPHMSTTVWVCWLLWAIDAWWERPTAARFVPMVAASALLILGGFPFIAEMGLGAAVLYTLLLATARETPAWGARTGWVGLAILLGFGFCAIPLISMVRWMAGVDTAARAGGSPLSLWPDAAGFLPGWAHAHARVETGMYVGTLGVLFAVAGLVLLIFKRSPRRLVGAFGLGLLAVGFVLTFELVPHRYLAWVPGLGNNGWGRAILLLDLGLAVLAAFWVDAVMASGRRVTAMILPVLAMAVQVADQGFFFRRFNGPVPSAWVFPEKPLLTRAKQGLAPFESVVADASYLVGGTLGSYGIPEWFAHGFKSVTTKALLARVADDPFTTPTATILLASKIRLDAPELRALAVRYVLSDAGLLEQTILPAFRDGTQKAMVALPELGAAAWRQYVDVPTDFSLDGIELRLATYGRMHLAGTVRLDIHSNDGESTEVAHATVDAATIVDGAMARFVFSPAVSLHAGSYKLSLSYQGGRDGEPITAWYTPGEGQGCRLDAQPALPPGCLIMRWISTQAAARGWQAVAADHGLLLIENLRSPRGPYVIPSLQAWPDASSSSDVVASQDRPAAWTFRYTAAAPGFLVLPMKADSAWHYRVGGKPTAPVSYLGALPALPVSGATVVHAEYRPASIRYGRWITLACAVLLVAFLAILSRAQRRMRAIE
jgi:hypothetical protein